MKQLLLIWSVFLLSGCCVATPIEIMPKVTKVDSHSHRITLTTDNPISSQSHVGVDEPGKNIEIIESKEGIIYIASWYKLEFYWSNPNTVIVNIEENPYSYERTVIVWVSRRVGSDCAFIVQEGRPEK